ncbi:Rhamnogalacturonate lyase-like protein [Drosera capensis]
MGAQMTEEVQSWPYDFPASEDFPKANQRANVGGRLFVHDSFVTPEKVPAKGSFVGLAPPGEIGSWQRDCKGYQFWTQTDEEGRFVINNVRPGDYNLYGWTNGYVGDFKHDALISLKIGHNADLGDLLFKPPRDGPTLWEIGEAERTAKEFFVPDPNPKYVNKLYVNHPDKFRQYGLWERYAELYPKEDLVYTINVSDYRKDWFYAQVTRKVGNDYDGSTWQVKFKLDNVDPKGVYKLRLALASATNAELEVRMNEPPPAPFIFSSGRIGNDNSIARHGIHGLFWMYNIDIEGSKLKQGENIMYLTQVKSSSPFQGIMYDYIRLEGPATSAPR